MTATRRRPTPEPFTYVPEPCRPISTPSLISSRIARSSVARATPNSRISSRRGGSAESGA
ncbi:MAG: hypothetical protein V8T86_12675 [Victivallis sp.]